MESNADEIFQHSKRTIQTKEITSTIRTPGMMGLSGKCPGKKLSLIVTFLIATTETPGLYSITLSTKRNGNLNDHRRKTKRIWLRALHISQNFTSANRKCPHSFYSMFSHIRPNFRVIHILPLEFWLIPSTQSVRISVKRGVKWGSCVFFFSPYLFLIEILKKSQFD